MTSFGGYSRTSYGGGDDGGGGFMGGTQQGSQGGGSGERKSNADDSLRPLTIKQLVDSKEPYPRAELIIDGSPTTQVTLVGQVRTVNPQATNLTYRIDDGTGMIDVKKWIDADKGETDPRIPLDTWVRVYGRVNTFNNKRSVNAQQIRPISDFNEVNYHLLEATYVHLLLTKGAGAGQENQHDEDGMFVDGGAGGSSSNLPSRLASCSRNARTFFAFLANGAIEGQHLNEVANGTKLSPRDIMSAAEELLGEGLIYTTVDDETWAVMEM